MYKDYMSYIKRIRDNLIQCGVSLPYSLVGDLEDPMELFRVSSAIDDILYYYKIMSIGGSNDTLQGFFLPLDGYYKNKMRELAYQEFMDVVDSYAKLLGADSSSVDIGLNPSMWDDDYDEEDYEDEEFEEEEYEEGNEGEYVRETRMARNDEIPLIGRFQSLENKGGALPDRQRKEKEGGLETRNSMERVQGSTSPSSVGAQGETEEDKRIFSENGCTTPSDSKEIVNEERQDAGWTGERIFSGNGSEGREHIPEEDTEGRNGNTGYDTPKEHEKEDIGIESEDFANLFSFDTEENSVDEESNNAINPLHSENTHTKNIFTGVPPTGGDSVEVVSYEEHGIYLDDITLDTDNTAEHGMYLDDAETDDYEELETYLDDTEADDYVEHGVYLDDIDTTTPSIEGDTYVEHGTYLDEMGTDEGFEVVEELEGWVSDEGDEEDSDNYDEAGFEEPEESWIEDDDEEVEDNIQYDEDGFEIVDEPKWGSDDDEEDYEEDDGIQYDEDGFEIVDEPQWGDDDEDEEYVEDDGIQYDEDGFEIVDEPQWGEDDDEEEYVEDDGIQYDEDGFEIVEEESWIEDDEEDEGEEEYDSEGFEEVDDFGWGSSDDDEDEIIEEQPPKQIQETTTQQVVTPPMRNEAEEVDITDKLTEGTNKILTSIKRGFAQFLSNQSQK